MNAVACPNTRPSDTAGESNTARWAAARTRVVHESSNVGAWRGRPSWSAFMAVAAASGDAQAEPATTTAAVVATRVRNSRRGVEVVSMDTVSRGGRWCGAPAHAG